MALSTNDWLVLAIAAFVAVVTLVRLMRQRRDQMLEELSREAELENVRLEQERKSQQGRKGAARTRSAGRN